MPYHDPFLFDLGLRPPTAIPSRPRAPPVPSPRPYHGHDPSLDMGMLRPRSGHVVAPAPNAYAPAPSRAHIQSSNSQDDVSDLWFANTSAKRINTEINIYQALKAANPTAEVLDTDAYLGNIYAYIKTTGDGEIESLEGESKLSALFDENLKFNGQEAAVATDPTDSTKSSSSGYPDSMRQLQYFPPSRRIDGGKGVIVANPLFERFLVKWHGHEFAVYIVDCRDGTSPYIEKRQYIITTEPGAALTLVQEAGSWQSVLHEEIWVFDQGWWQKDAALYAAIQKSDWKDIILPEALKEDLLKTVVRFYDSEETYHKLRVPWKRGLIFYGPPGNGKTVTIKATMKTLLDRQKTSIPTLYVKSFTSFAGSEYAISMIFERARQQAPCYLVFEDLDSLVKDDIRSFFLNAVDGLSENEGILMVGSTNHLDRLDPGIAKRPSRFDRKYLFPDPALAERKRYCQYWQRKLKGNEQVKFPNKLLEPIAGMMGGFSFASMQEAFVSSLVRIANEEQDDGQRDDQWDLVEGRKELETKKEKGGDDGDLNEYILYRYIKVVVEELRKELSDGKA